MIEFDVDMGYLLEAGELDCVILNDENGEYEPMKFTPELGSGICKPTEPERCLDGTDCPAWLCSECGELFELGSNFCSNCGAKVVGK